VHRAPAKVREKHCDQVSGTPLRLDSWWLAVWSALPGHIKARRVPARAFLDGEPDRLGGRAGRTNERSPRECWAVVPVYGRRPVVVPPLRNGAGCWRLAFASRAERGASGGASTHHADRHEC